MLPWRNPCAIMNESRPPAQIGKLDVATEAETEGDSPQQSMSFDTCLICYY
jgi:hypothetical protein